MTEKGISHHCSLDGATTYIALKSRAKLGIWWLSESFGCLIELNDRCRPGIGRDSAGGALSLSKDSSRML